MAEVTYVACEAAAAQRIAVLTIDAPYGRGPIRYVLPMCRLVGRYQPTELPDFSECGDDPVTATGYCAYVSVTMAADDEVTVAYTVNLTDERHQRLSGTGELRVPLLGSAIHELAGGLVVKAGYHYGEAI